MFVDIGNNKVCESLSSSIAPKHRLRVSHIDKEGLQQGVVLLDESSARLAQHGHHTGGLHDLYNVDDGYLVAKSSNSSSSSGSAIVDKKITPSSRDSGRKTRCEKDASVDIAHLRAPASGEARQYVHHNTAKGDTSDAHRRHHSHHHSSHTRHRGTHSRGNEDNSIGRGSPTSAVIKRAIWHDSRGLLVPPIPAKDAVRQRRSYSELQCTKPHTQAFMSNSAQLAREAATRQRLVDGRRNVTNNNNNNDSNNWNSYSKLSNSFSRRAGDADPPVVRRDVGEVRKDEAEDGNSAPAHAIGGGSHDDDGDDAGHSDGAQDENALGCKNHSFTRLVQEGQSHVELRRAGGYAVAAMERPSNGIRVGLAERHLSRVAGDAVEGAVEGKKKGDDKGDGGGAINGVVVPTVASSGGGVAVARLGRGSGSARNAPTGSRRNHARDATGQNCVVTPVVDPQGNDLQADKAQAAQNDEDKEELQEALAEGAKPHAGPQLAQTKIQLGVQLKHWVIISRIGAGSFGETFTAIEVSWPVPQDDSLDVSPAAAALLEHLPPAEERREVCIKVEQENKNVLRLEALALKKVQPCPQVVRYYASGCTAGMNYLVMEKLGPNLADLRRRSPHGTFNIYTTLKAGISCLQAIRGVHDQGLVHRDIKPSNFVTGLPGTAAQATCFLIDFGLARRFRRSNGTIRPARANAGFRGTSRYASVASHHHNELGRVDDLWSLLFMLVEFATGSLPWRKYKEKEAIGRCKEESISPYLVRNLPREFQPFLVHLTTLSYEDEPDYNLLLGLMQNAVKRRGYPADKLVDWELDPSLLEATAEAEWHAAPHHAPAERRPEANGQAAHDSGPGRGPVERPRVNGATGGLAHGNSIAVAPGQELVTPAAVATPVTAALAQPQGQPEHRNTTEPAPAGKAVPAGAPHTAPPLAPVVAVGDERVAEVVGDGREKGGGRVPLSQPPPRPHTAELNSASRAQALNTSTLRVSEVELSCRPHSPALAGFAVAGGERDGVADEFSSDAGAAASHAGMDDAARPSAAQPPTLSRPPILAPSILAPSAINEANATKRTVVMTPPHELASSAPHDTEEVEVFDTVDIFSPREAETRSRPRLDILLSPPVPYTELTPREESPPPLGVPAAGPVITPPTCSPHPVAVAASGGVTGTAVTALNGARLGKGASPQTTLSPEQNAHKGARHKVGKLHCNCSVM